MLQEEQLEGPLVEALELVPDDDGVLDSIGAPIGLPNWLTIEGLLPPVKMGLYMWEFNRIYIYKPPIISSLKHLNGGWCRLELSGLGWKPSRTRPGSRVWRRQERLFS